MIYKVYPQDVFEKESWKSRFKITKNATKATFLTKDLLNSSIENNLEQQLNLKKKINL